MSVIPKPLAAPSHHPRHPVTKSLPTQRTHLYRQIWWYHSL